MGLSSGDSSILSYKKRRIILVSMKPIIITISGFHGVGKSTLSKYISNKYGLKRISSGEIFRRLAVERGLTIEEFSKMAEEDPCIDSLIDEIMVKECLQGGCVADGLLAGWFLKEVADIKIWLKSPLEIRVKRICEREGRGYEEVYRETVYREDSEVKRFKDFYDIDVYDLSIYDIVIDTSKIGLNTLFQVVDLLIKDLDK